MLPNYLGRTSEGEDQAWQTHSVEKLISSSRVHSDAYDKAYGGKLREYGLHFSMDGFWTGGTSAHGDPVVEIDIPKAVLLQLAKAGKIEVGFTGGKLFPPEIIALESAWPTLMNYVSHFTPAQAVH